MFSNVFKKNKSFRLIVFINLVFIKKKCVIQKAVDEMRKRVDDKLKIQESKAAKLIADLDKFEKDY